jgi:aspartate kinase
MKVFKFGGASVKDAAAVRNVASILKRYDGEKLVVVISAMGKTTNALELVHDARFHGKNYRDEIQKIKAYHQQIGAELFGENESLMRPVRDQFDALEEMLAEPCSVNYDQEYDSIVCYGELISTALVYSYLLHEGFSVAWADARQIVRTDNRYRDARVNWQHSEASCAQIRHQLENKDLVIIQGFIGSTTGGHTTTLGREGSDFTAAIMAYLLDAADVTIWKDVPGMLNADPKWFSNTVKLDRISFREAIELAYYGASVIHPKTIKPLQNKGIPLYIRSFVHPEEEGSVIQESMDYDNLVPSYIFKPNQVLVSFTPKDFSFVVEDNLREIFEEISRLGIRISLMENSAISFSIVTDKDSYKLDQLFESMKGRYQVKYNENLTLITIRHWDEKTLEMLTSGKEILLEQKSRQTVRLVVR